MNYWLFIIPIFSAFIGWFANRLLIRSLFRPRQTKKIIGISIQGILPKHQQELASRIGKYVSNEFSFGDIEKKISDPANLEKIMPMIEKHVDDFLRNRLKEEMPMISMFVGDKTINKMKLAFMKEIQTLFPQVMQQFAGNLKEDLNIESMVENKIISIDPQKLESSLYQHMGKELKMAGMLGALIGFILGVIQVLILVLVS